MARLAALAAAALAGLMLADCAGGSFGQAGLSLPTDGVQTVSDAADSLVAHRTTASQKAQAAIAVTDGFGSFVREIGADQRSLAGRAGRNVAARTLRDYTVERDGKRILSASELVQRGRAYCQSGAGYLAGGIPSLDRTFGWQSGVFSGGSRGTDSRGSAIWSANASGAVLQGSIGSLSIAPNAHTAACPANAPAFIVRGGTSANAFTMPISMEFRRGELVNLSVVNARFASGDTLEVATRSDRQSAQVRGVIMNGRSELGTFVTNASGDGTLTITSSGAQYTIGDWIVVGI
ncbi:MAG: hypothetical protein JO146_08710 [Candidatus Eremiobacteraeota bacterium]|nr:hypothetical protein [Candidatus Eremiobacteraeota bacterium]